MRDDVVRVQLAHVETLLADRRMAVALSPDALHWLGDNQQQFDSYKNAHQSDDPAGANYYASTQGISAEKLVNDTAHQIEARVGIVGWEGAPYGYDANYGVGP